MQDANRLLDLARTKQEVRRQSVPPDAAAPPAAAGMDPFQQALEEYGRLVIDMDGDGIPDSQQ